MPLFFNKFSPKKTPTRKASVFLANKNLSPKRIEKELGPEVGPIRLRLGDQETVFEAGLWIPGGTNIFTYRDAKSLHSFPNM